MIATPQGRWAHRLIPFLLFVATITVFLPALQNGFVNWDDDKNLLDNLHYRGLGPTELRWMWTNHLTGHYIPITWMSFGLDYLAWGVDPLGYHLTNLILHASNAALFYFLALMLLRMAQSKSWVEEGWEIPIGAAFASLFFALHPLRVESVVWVTERRDVLSGLFCLLATLAYLRAAGNHGRRYYLASLICFVLALLSKEIALTLPAAFLVIDVFPLRRLGGAPGRWIGRPVWDIWLEKIPYFLFSLVCGLATWVIGAREGTAASLAEVGWLSRIEISMYGLGFYILKTLAPVSLSPMYLLTKWKIDPLGRSFALFAVTALAVTTVAIVYRRKYPALLPVMLVYVFLLLPVAGITQNGRQIVADRYSYLSCLGWALLAGAAVQMCWRRRSERIGRLMILGMGTICLGGLSLLTSRQILVWRDSETLWTDVISRDAAPIAYQNLGMALAERGNVEGAIAYFWEALRLDPDDAEVHNDMGAVLLATGKADEASLHFQQALRHKQNLPNSHYGLGYTFSLKGRVQEAIEEYQAALRLKPDYEAAQRELKKALTLLGKSQSESRTH